MQELQARESMIRQQGMAQSTALQREKAAQDAQDRQLKNAKLLQELQRNAQ